MNLWLTFRIALRALRKNLMRSTLTVLGVVIGIAAVTTMVSIGQSASALVQGEFESLGTNVIVVTPKMANRGGLRSSASVTLTAEDSAAIARECSSVAASSPIVGTSGQLIYGNTNWQPKEVHGVGSQYLTVRNWSLLSGAFFGEREIASADKVCVLGKTVVEKLFQTSNPLGQKIRVRNIPLRVIGVLEEKGANMVGDDQDDIVLIPYSTVLKRLHGSSFNNVHAIMLSAMSLNQMTTATTDVRWLLAERHRIVPGEPNDFEVTNTTEIANVLGTITGTMTAMLASIAAISLLVGGVGIMNIMLVSVTERTREIGIRMAVGATGGDILRQFLTEAIILSFIGGMIGLALGIGASAGATMLINSVTSGRPWPIIISLPAAAIAILFSACVGMFFGFYPAQKASRLDPIDALRYE